MNNHLITKSVKLFLYWLIIVAVISLITFSMQINLVNDFDKNLYSFDEMNALAEKNDSRVANMSFLYVISLLISYFLIGRWFYVSTKINHLLGIKGLNFSPGWSVGWYFIPFANLVMPYQSLKETFKASFNTEEWQNNRVPYDFPIWWATYWMGNILGQLSARMSWGDEVTLEQIIQISYVNIIADILLIINAIFLLRIINIIYLNQKDKIFK